ncbi:hypothetical protein GPECTOR_9g581 [Gonium pectorale]|uniref:Uncharacterized protein n=1 Tax=Gonium pectorale TaxID=33097 RepID=A0A150GRU4_GONPE|nr:hypothetical protein GPECTOR_9g581 [Gonium pectorale]|eukprot:KXZ52537.1 hypothetical protein GPECTOR_9g581 [Gonium pectorale]
MVTLHAELQRRAQSAESRAALAEEQLAQLQNYMTRASVSYQKEIVRLRAIIGQMEGAMGAGKGTYLTMHPLEGAGGGGPLRPAAEVLEEMMTRGSAWARGQQPQQPGGGGALFGAGAGLGPNGQQSLGLSPGGGRAGQRPGEGYGMPRSAGPGAGGGEGPR